MLIPNMKNQISFNVRYANLASIQKFNYRSIPIQNTFLQIMMNTILNARCVAKLSGIV